MGNIADGGLKNNETAACNAMHACAHTVSHTRDTAYHRLSMIVHVVKFIFNELIKVQDLDEWTCVNKAFLDNLPY